jgi:hypothetical protein
MPVTTYWLVSRIPWGPLGGLTVHGLCDCLVQPHVLLGKVVLLQLHVIDPVDEQIEDNRLSVDDLGLADQVGAGESLVALPGLGLEVGEEARTGWPGSCLILWSSMVLACTVWRGLGDSADISIPMGGQANGQACANG